MKEKHTYHHADASGKLPDALCANPYTVPNGYFENLHHRILQNCQHIEGAHAAFAVPSGYFGQLEDSITAKIAEQQLKAIVSESGFSVPKDYFSNMEALLLADRKIRENVHEPGFNVPEHYFDALQNHIADRTSRETAIPIRKITRPRWMAYAAAACLALVMSVIGILGLVDDGSETTSPLASVSDQEILNYLEFYGTANDMIYISEHLDDFDEHSIGEGISEDDIEAYLNHTL